MTPERPTPQEQPQPCGATRCRNGAVFLMLALVLPVLPTSAVAVPANPERPFAATTCPAAQDRLHEALSGSPLISKGENAQVLRDIQSRTEALCGKDVVHELISQFQKTHKLKAD